MTTCRKEHRAPRFQNGPSLSEPTVQVTIKMDIKLKRAAFKAADDLGISLNEMIRIMLRKLIQEKQL